MKQFLVLIIFISFTVMTFSKGVMIVNFYANRNEIALKYCENKSKPQLHCNGNCFLMRTLAKEEKKERALTDIFQKLSVLCNETHFHTLNIAKAYIKKCKNYLLLDSKIHSLANYQSLLKPPIDFIV